METSKGEDIYLYTLEVVIYCFTAGSSGTKIAD